jgi:hypothetical protein
MSEMMVSIGLAVIIATGSFVLIAWLKGDSSRR